jgi:UDP-2,4-diacetamido-2,4,6-trideoxy-beta-L-altropyranose hydrolase
LSTLIKTAAFIAHASQENGGGHVYRCLPIYEELIKQNWNCVFLINKSALDLIPELSKCEYIVYRKKDVLNQLTSSYFKGKARYLFIDDYSFSKDSESPLRDCAKQLIIFDDTADIEHDGDYFICISPDIHEDIYKSKVPKNSKFLLGPSFASLRNQFFLNRYSALESKKDIVENIFISAGASDPLGITELFVEAICLTNYRKRLSIVLGSNNKLSRKLLENNNIDFKVYSSVENIADIMSSSDIALGASGNSSWERCCLGIPSIIFETASNQNKIAKYLENVGAAINLGKPRDLSIDDVSKAIQEIIDDPIRRADMSSSAFGVTDGLGVRRILANIFPEISKSGLPIYLNKATIKDIELVYEWQREPEMRKYCLNQEIPNLEENRAWMTKKLSDPLCIFNIIYLDKSAVGVVRCDIKKNNKCLLSIYLSKKYRKLGIARAALVIIKKQLYDFRMHAEILENNIDSINLFKSAGFEYENNNYTYKLIQND